MGAVNVMTGVYTGRSPKDKFFVKDETSENTVWWTSEEYKTTTNQLTQNVGKQLKNWQLKNCLTRDCSLLMLSVVLTKTLA